MLYKSSSPRVLALLLLPIILLAKDGIADQNPVDASSSRFLQSNIIQMYDKNIDNFEKVLNFSRLSKDLNFKADVILGLHSAMSDVRHLDNPLHAIPMYNELEALINANISDSNLEQSDILEAKRTQLAVVIIEKGAEVLESAVFLKNCKDNAMVQDLFKELYAGNKTLSNLTITNMVNKVRWMMPMEKQIVTMSNISRNVLQNIDVLMALYNEEQFTSTEREAFEAKLRQLRLDQVDTMKLEKSVDNEVDNSDKTAINKSLINGDVCLYQKHTNGSNMYLQECYNDYRPCIQYYPKSSKYVVYNFYYDSIDESYLLYNKFFPRRLLRIINDDEQNDGVIFNARTYGFNEIGRHWTAEIEDNRVIIKNVESSLYLCAGSSKAISSKNEWMAYTRDLPSYQEHSEECKWFVEDCSGYLLNVTIF